MGRKSVTVGRNAESAFDAQAEILGLEKRALVIRHYPEYRPSRYGAGRFQSHGMVDRSVIVPDAAAHRVAFVEIKSVNARDRHTLRSRYHQYRTMIDAYHWQGIDGFYFVYWQVENEYRLHNVASVIHDERRQRVTLMRNASGRHTSTLCDMRDGYPDWFTPLLNAFRL